MVQKGHIPSSDRMWARQVPMHLHAHAHAMARHMRDCAMTRRRAGANEYINHDINGTMTFEFIDTIEAFETFETFNTFDNFETFGTVETFDFFERLKPLK